MKLSGLRTKTISSTTADGLDGLVRTFVQSLTEEQAIVVRFAVDAGVLYAFIVYTG